MNKKFVLSLLFLDIFVVLMIISFAVRTSHWRPSFKREHPEPIDVVYTWVNGSDPWHIQRVVLDALISFCILF